MQNSSNPKFFTGQVSRSDPATGLIHVDPHASYSGGQTGMVQGVPLVNVFSVTLGFKETLTYPIGAQVFCMDITAGVCLILGMLPDHDVGDTSYWSRVSLKTEDTNSQDVNCNTLGYGEQLVNMFMMNNNRPTDVAEGEYVVANELGVLLGLLQQVAILKGSELAQVQCYLMDDLVKLISHNFSHYTAAGEYNIWHDGKAIMVEQGMTHLPRESLGIPQTQDNEQRAFTEIGTATADDSEDYYELKNGERSKAIERLKIFAGRLGDFLHIFLSRPDSEATRSLDGKLGGNFDRGLFDLHISTDGRVALRSVTGIALEKTNWIRVPHRVRSPEDPKGDKEEDIEFKKKTPFEWDQTYTVENNPIGYCLQLRDYLAYTQDKLAYQNFEEYKKDFNVSKSSSDQETDLAGCKDIDPKTEYKFSDYALRRSGVYIMDNGGIAIIDAWGSAIVMEGGDISLQPAKDLIAQPLRHAVVKAGHSLQMAAKKHVDLSSTEEGFRLKTKKVQHFYAKDEGIILQTDSSTEVGPMPKDQAYDQFGGILLHAPETGIFTHGKKIFNTAEEKALYRAKETLTIESEDEDVWIIPQNNLYLFPTQDLIATTSGSITIAGSGSAIFAGGGSTSLGKQGQTIGMISTPGSIPSSMDGVLPVDAIVSAIDSARSILDDVVQQMMYPFQENSKFEEIKFRFLKSDKYNLQSSEDFIPMTIAQQNEQDLGIGTLTSWSEQEEQSTLPFPGKDLFSSFYLKASGMQNIKKADSGNDYETRSAEGLQSQGPSLTLTDLMSYKVKE